MRRVILAMVSTVAGLVLLLSFKTHTQLPVTAAPASNVGTSGSSGDSSSSGSASSGSDSSSSSTAPASPVVKTVTGDSADTRWGPVQVQVTLTDGKVTAAEAVVYPQENQRDVEINTYAIPTLNQEAVAAGSANIDMVSGATYTSEGYITSLQSALNKV